VLTSRGLVASGVTGTRKAGTDVAATIDDQWHLGSDTKAMTAVIIATFVERGRLTWETTLGDVFTELAAGFPSDFRAITVTQLLSHHAGLPANLAWREIARSGPPLPEQRLNALKIAATTTLTSKPGTKFEYSNLGYTLAGAIAERVGGKPWEELMRDIVFTPLGMTNCGFGGLGTPGQDRSAVAAHCERSADGVEWSGRRQCGGNGSGRHSALLDSQTGRSSSRTNCGANAALARSSKRRPIKHCTRRDSEGTMHSGGASPHECGPVAPSCSTTEVTR
jgi:CubicO group peptidase (beta-lactamase class C family)